ncbi:Protein SCAI [Choanephora cucurbitarum]|uniref:Protein SCAI n=1 Tax=Choanephora cucurbitarum TaxID=101091 RepID=A0A1C7NNF7_9FUNG|nr:Protein SCAI [Choanephora cucurbitarum]
MHKAPMDTQPVASAASTAAHSNATNINNSTAAVASALVNSAVAAAPLNTTGGPQSSNTGETVTAETGEDTMRKQKLVEEFQYLLEKSQSLFSGLRDLPPTGSHRQWRPYFEKTFEVYTKLWKFQQTHRSILEDKSNYGLKRWEVGEIASKIGQLYYHYYLRTSETNYLYEAYVFYEAIHERQYFKDIIEVKNSALMIKKMRYYARFIIVCLLLNKDENVRQLIAELEQLIEEYTKSFKPPDAKEWQMVLEEIRTFTEAEKKLVPINLDRTPDKIQHRLAPDLAERSLGNLPKLRLQEAILVGSYQKQIKFSELTLDMYRMLQSLERKPYIIHPSVAANAPHQKKPNEDKEKKDTAIKEDGTVKNNTTAHTTNASISSNPMASVANTSSSSTAANTVTNAANATTTTNASNASNASTVIPSNTVATNNSTNSVNNTGAADSISAAATTTTTAATANNAANNNTNNASVTASNAVPSISTSAPTNASATHGLTSQVQNERNAKRSNPHKYLLYRPSLTQLLVYISTAFKDTGDHAALLLYLSADGYAYPERTVPGYGGGVLTSQRSKQTTDRSNTGPAALSNIANSTAAATNTTSMNTSSLNHAANNTLGAGVNTSSTQAASSANTNTINTNGVVGGTVTNSNNTNNPNQANAATSVTNASMSHAIETATIPPSVHCLHPADLIPFTRKPLFLIVDSDNSVEFKSMPNVFDQPVMCLMSPVEYPSSVQDKSEIGSLFTLFLHTPLLGFCSVSDIGNLDQSKWDECVRKIAAMEKLIGDLLISDVNVDKNIKRFMSDDFLYCFIVRFVLCGIFLRYHSSFKDEKAFPSSVPSVPESIYVSTEIVTMLGDLTAIADVGTYFSLPAYASSSTPTTAAALINTTNANVLSSSPTSTMATLVDTTNTKE